ncbi:transmembrane protein 53-like isoform X1 [Pomacea canaliculata]|uniref:transmembrane protein 53-like isoform X1 n=1 Tax=Pomacea canaliculata TaxID=400727 RepID=UPI000D73E5EC|nr:transmembrane protein 53-like isoform X1 [Pomacea canaliculata]
MAVAATQACFQFCRTVCAKPAHINPALFTRCLSDSSHLVRFKIGSFEFCSPDPTGKACNPHPRPVVVLVGWLNAKKQHLEKFADLYRVKGFDVLTMDVSPIHIVRPTVGKKYAMELLEVLQKNDILASKSIVIHGFSIGAFIYTQLQLAFEKDPTTFLDVCQRMTGVVMDSPAYMDHMCQGIADSASSVSIVRILINSSLRFYLRMFPKSVTFHYCEAERIFYSNTVPTLFLYSSADKISSTAVTERYIEAWRKKNLFVVGQKWHDSPHVGHLRKHPEEYSKALFFFLDRLNLGKIVQKTSS